MEKDSFGIGERAHVYLCAKRSIPEVGNLWVKSFIVCDGEQVVGRNSYFGVLHISPEQRLL